MTCAACRSVRVWRGSRQRGQLTVGKGGWDSAIEHVATCPGGPA
jgi:hypothetical protein